jgi:hypothetical protein
LKIREREIVAHFASNLVNLLEGARRALVDVKGSNAAPA